DSSPGDRPRRFNLGDGLLLIGALALTLSTLVPNWFARIPGRIRFWREMLPNVVSMSPPFLAWGPLARRIVAEVIHEVFIQLLSAVLLGLTLVHPVMRLRRPRPPWRAVFRQSGFVVCLGVIVGSLILADLEWVAGIQVQGAVLACALLLFWPVLGLPPWRSEASGIDRLGRAVGWGWIVAVASETLLNYLG
ncbi:MAG TPA: hypothetical protein VFF52_03860, partial [Isosphaeraceae bacterium]|nr:hypothetical protein [Isosphaeraceae bacterium]